MDILGIPLFDTGGWTGYQRVAVRDDGGWRWFSPPISGQYGNISSNMLEVWLTLAMQKFSVGRIKVVQAPLTKTYDECDMSTLDDASEDANEEGA